MPSEYKNDLSNIRNLDIRPSTIEGCIVRFADKIAYLGRDIEDAIVSSLIKDSDIPSPIRKALGSKNGEIIDSLVTDLIENSDDNGIGFSDKKFDLLIKLRDFNYNKIYNHAKLTEYKKFVSKIIASICSHHRELFCRYGLDYKAYENEPLTISKRFGSYLKKMNDLYIKEDNVPNQILSDYISGMTDSYAIRIMKDISLPSDL
jgi:dGTPase